MDNEEKTKKNLYMVKIWRQNDDVWNPTLPPVTLMTTKYVYAKSKEHAIRTLKERAKRDAVVVGRIEDHELVSMLFSREDITLSVDQIWDTRTLDKEQEKQNQKNMILNTKCKECGEELDDDYCQSCGWRRQSWLDRATK